MKITPVYSSSFSNRPRVKKHSGGPGLRPLVWKSGPDPISHEQYTAWGRSRAQAHFRGEEWHLTFEEYQQIWAGQWHLRGRTRNTLCMSRSDNDLPWSRNNCDIITRAEHNRRQAQNRSRSGPRPRGQRRRDQPCVS